MATSGSVDFNRTRDQIIEGAMRLVEAIASGETPAADETADAADALNQMVKAWQAQGIHLWTMTEGTLFLTKGTAKYTLGPSGDHATTSYAETTLSAAASNTDTTLTVTSITGMTASDNIGIVKDDGTFHWTTISGSPSGSTVTLATAIDGAAASGNTLYTYTSKIDRPLKIIDARREDSNQQEIPFSDILTRDEYFDLPDKTTTGLSHQGYYDPQLTNGVLYLWPAPSSIDDIINFTFTRPLEDFDAATDNPDFPQEWISALKFNLAVEIAPEYGVTIEKQLNLKGMAKDKLDQVLGFDTEVSVYFAPEEFW